MLAFRLQPERDILITYPLNSTFSWGHCKNYLEYNATGISIGQGKGIYLMSIHKWDVHMDIKFQEKNSRKNMMASVLGYQNRNIENWNI